ncbi:hypothetical protein HMPREF9454_00954 [Megamonas funiformis YIT 11815]|uniref:Uncharacterized protein n=2 Tax=Megamonas funiformis TaxID=437897 RepID=A0ABN0EJA9_9FIRM|nr:hypothetical protein HMPREF9454_00954 [Megamonas funiformis YIT 11815]
MKGGETMSIKRNGIMLTAKITGEMNVEDIPVANWADIDALKGDDTDPLEVIMSIPAGKSTRGWNYTSNALNSIVGEVNSTGLPGFLGHQKAENVATEFPTPVTHWIGAKMENGTAYFRGLIDKSAGDLKRWIRGKAINQVSIFGYPQLQQNSVTGETDVIDYKGLSIDWTPLNRAGMPTSLMATSGEMDAIAQPADTSHEALRETLRSDAYAKLGNNSSDGYVSVNSVYDDYFIAYRSDYSNRGNEETYYKIGYAKGPDNTIVLGEPVEVRRKETWEPVGEMEIKNMNNKLKDLLDDGTITKEDLKQACGEIGISNNEEPNKIEQACGEMFGKTGDELLNDIKSAAELLKQSNNKNKEKIIDKVLSEKVSGEMAQNVVKKMLHTDSSDEAVIAGEIDSILADKSVQALLANTKIDIVPPINVNNNNNSFFVTKKVSI